MKRLKGKRIWWLLVVFYAFCALLLIVLESFLRKSNTLLPICIPWMYDYIFVVVLSVLLALIKKYIGKTSKPFSDIWATYVVKTFVVTVILPAIILLPNKYLAKNIKRECQGVITDEIALKVSKSTSSTRNYLKIQLVGENVSFWYESGKKSTPVGTKCILSVQKGFFGLRFVDNVDFLVE